MENLAGDEGRGFQIQHCLTTSSITVNCPRGCRAARAAGESSGCVGVSTTAGDTAFTRIPLRAYSFASDVVATIRPPLEIGQRRRNVDVGVFGPGVGVNVTT